MGLWGKRMGRVYFAYMETWHIFITEDSVIGDWNGWKIMMGGVMRVFAHICRWEKPGCSFKCIRSHI